MTEAEVHAVVTGLLRELLEKPGLEVKPGDREKDIPGFDSGMKVSLVLAVEERFGIRMRGREIDALRQVGDWTALVLRHRAGSAGA